jgi:hypothetical protein
MADKNWNEEKEFYSVDAAEEDGESSITQFFHTLKEAEKAAKKIIQKPGWCEDEVIIWKLKQISRVIIPVSKRAKPRYPRNG